MSEGSTDSEDTEPQSDPGYSITVAKALYGFIWRNSSKQQLLTCAVALVTLPLTLAPIELQRRIIDDAISEKSLDLLMTLVLIYAAVVLGQQIVKFTYNVLRGRIAEHLCRVMRDRIIRAPAAKDTDNGTVVSMLTGEVEPVGGFGGDAYAQVVTEGGVLITIFAYMFYTEFWLAMVAVVAFIPQALATPLVQDRINEQSAKRIAEIRSIGSDVLKGKKGDTDSEKRALGRTGKIFNIRMLIFKLKFGLKALLNLMDHSADLAVLGAGGYMVIQGQTEVGVVVAFLSGLGQLRSPWRTLVSYFRVSSDAQVRFKLLRERIEVV
jgi:ABC-type bacteriocin/lantibiotic exporter with double-glycine peptidase domain